MAEQKHPNESGVHFEYKIDVSKPTPNALEKIKNDLIRKIGENVRAEQQDEGGIHRDQRMDHDRHYSIHSRD